MAWGRRGVTLVELVLAMGLLAVLGAVTLRAMLTLSRHATAVSEHAAVQAGVRTGMLLLQTELRELGGSAGGPPDLLRIAPDSLTYRATRGHGLVCAVSVAQLRILNTPEFPFRALRAISPGRDSLLLFVEESPTSSLDDHWIRLPVLSVGASSCGGAAAIAVGTADLAVLLPSGDLASVVPGSPVRTFEIMRLAEYSSLGQHWLGMASLSGGELIQPVSGPLTGTGLTFAYLGRDGAPVSAPSAVRSIRMSLIGATERPVAPGWGAGTGGIVAETLSARVFLRNLPR